MSRYPFECPQCGAAVPAGRLACPECGSDARTGWQSSEEIDYQSVELPEAESESRPPNTRPGHLVSIGAILAVIAFLLWILLP